MITRRVFWSSFALAAICSLGCETTFVPPADNNGGGSSEMGTAGVGTSGNTSGGGGVVANAGGAGGGAPGGSGGVISNGGSGGADITDGGSGGPAVEGGAGHAAPTEAGPSPQMCPATSALKAGNTNGTLPFGGMTRSYIVHVPASYTGKMPVPLVLDFHGILSDATSERDLSGWGAKADQEGFIVVWPNGIDKAWNVGPCCTTSRTVDDVGFSKAIVKQISSELCIDAKRVYASGYSMGGGMTIDIGCNAADIFAAIAPAAFDLAYNQPNDWPCHPSRPISIVDFRSTGDGVVPYNGGPTHPPNGLPITFTFYGAVNTFQQWAQLDKCTGSPVDDSALGTGCQTYKDCAEGTQVTLCTKQGGGHEPPNPQVAWNVLKKYTLP